MRYIFSSTAVTLGTVFIPLTVIAQAETLSEPISLEEIVVTAQKREQSLQDVPISVNVVSGDALKERDLNDIEDITSVLPSIAVADNGVNQFLFIRGIGSGENQGFEQSVGTFIDGVYFGRGRQARQQFLDIDRIEVLRGPQSIFFGNSTIAGAFNITTRNPSEEWEGYVSGQYEFELEGKEFEAAVGGPLSDTIGIRLAGRYAQSDGWVKNIVDNKTAPETESWAVRGTISWQPTDRFNLDYKIGYSENDVVGTPYDSLKCPPKGTAPGLTCALSLADPAGNPNTMPYVRSAGGEPVPVFPLNGPIPDIFADEYTKSNLTYHVLNGTYDIGDTHTLSFVTGYFEAEDDEILDPDQTRYGIMSVERYEEYDQFSQEIRLASNSTGPLEYMLGAYFQKSNLTLGKDFRINLAFPADTGPFTAGTPIQVNQTQFFHQNEELFSVFAQAKYRLTDKLSISAGTRYSNVRKDAVSTQGASSFDGNDPASPAGLAFIAASLSTELGTSTGDLEHNRLVPEVIVEYDINDEMRVYAKYSDGFKAGGFDAEYKGQPGLSGFQFSPEEVTSYEIGAKTSFLNNSIHFNISLYRSEFSELQVAIFNAETATFLTTNAGKSVSQGVEIEAAYQILHNLRLDLSMAYLDAYYEEFRDAPCTVEQKLGLVSGCIAQKQDLTGQSLAFSPEFSGTMRLSYFTPLSDNLELGANVDLVYTDEYFTSLDNDPDFAPDNVVKINLQVSLSDQENGWKLALIANNLTNEKQFTSGINWPVAEGSKLYARERPRTVALQFSYEF